MAQSRMRDWNGSMSILGALEVTSDNIIYALNDDPVIA